MGWGRRRARASVPGRDRAALAVGAEEGDVPSLFRTRMGSIIIVVVAVAVSNIIVMVVVVVAIILILKLSFCNLQSACKFTLNLLFFP